MDRLFRIEKYLRYVFRAKGISNIHSPFVFDFVKNVLYDRRIFYAYDHCERLRSRLMRDERKIQLSDHGTGNPTSGRYGTIGSILKRSVLPAKRAQLLFRIIDHYACEKVIELGTSLGITTIYLASANKNSSVLTFEGDPQIAVEAQKNFDSFRQKNIQLIPGKFEDTFEPSLEMNGKIDFIFFDGNHRKEPTQQYFETALRYAHNESIFVFDDIYWSKEMKEAWIEIRNHERVSLSMDLFWMGILFFRRELSKQQFVLRF